MIRAFVAGLLVAITVPLLGSFLVARRYSLIADSLAHASLAGVGAALVLGTSPVVVAIPVTILGGLILEYLRQGKRVSGESSLAILMSGGLAIAVVLANLARGARTDFTSYLFGSIATTSRGDIVVLIIATLIVVALVAFKYRAFLHIAFDEEGARIAGYHVTALNYLLIGMTALVVVLSLRIVGGLLISALLVMPVVTAERLARSFGQTILLACLIALMAVICGLVAAFYLGIAAGGAIVLAALILFIVSLLLRP
jgi:zinc transport system permease protein